ncbi:MAG: hypothetical protein IJH18_00590 [Bacilli bacterium]|nr:hypothetical protein [Bacilli bacterium]
MKRLVNMKIIALVFVIALVSILTLNTKKAKAAGTVTWSGTSSITIEENINNITNPIAGTRTYSVTDNTDAVVATTTVTYTGNETISANQINKTTTINLSNLTFTEAGDYSYSILPEVDAEYGDNGFWLNAFFQSGDDPKYEVIVSVRNEVDANNIATGNLEATLVLNECTFNPSTGNYDVCSKVSPASGTGTLNAHYVYIPDDQMFSHIELGKEVKGTGAEINKYFPFTINLQIDSNVCKPLNCNRWSFPISDVDATATYNGSTVNNPTSITPGTPVTVYLKDGQIAVIGEGHEATRGAANTFDTIPVRCSTVPIVMSNKYNLNKSTGIKKLSNFSNGRIKKLDGSNTAPSQLSISETAGDYTAAYTINGDTSQSGSSFSDVALECNTNEILFENTRTMAPLTGVIINIAAYLIVIGIAIGGFLLFRNIRKIKLSK